MGIVDYFNFFGLFICYEIKVGDGYFVFVESDCLFLVMFVVEDFVFW